MIQSIEILCLLNLKVHKMLNLNHSFKLKMTKVRFSKCVEMHDTILNSIAVILIIIIIPIMCT